MRLLLKDLLSTYQYRYEHRVNRLQTMLEHYGGELGQLRGSENERGGDFIVIQYLKINDTMPTWLGTSLKVSENGG